MGYVKLQSDIEPRKKAKESRKVIHTPPNIVGWEKRPTAYLEILTYNLVIMSALGLKR
jgi:hypothetical protein